MKKIWRRIKYFNENDAIKLTLVAIFVIVFVLILFNQTTINFSVNGFSSLAQNELQVYFLDVGQATSTFVVLPNRETLLIDTGSEDSEDDLLESVDWILDKNNLSDVDYLILTHSDADHVGGAAAILEKYNVFVVYRPKILARSEFLLANTYGFEVVYTDAYDEAITAVNQEPNCQIEFTEEEHLFSKYFTIDIYPAQKESYSETNAYSPFVALTCFGKTFLFTGDVTSSRENEFLSMLEEREMNLQVDFLSVAHHGSRYSTTEEFLQKIKPQYAFISAGDASHPAQQVLRRLEDCGVQDIFVTKADGTIGVGVSSDGNFVILDNPTIIDLPTVVVVLCLLCFVIIKFIDQKGKESIRFKPAIRHKTL